MWKLFISFYLKKYTGRLQSKYTDFIIIKNMKNDQQIYKRLYYNFWKITLKKIKKQTFCTFIRNIV